MSHYQPAHTSFKSLSDSICLALKRDDIPRAMQLSWHLMMQPQCPLQLQAHAVLVHSAASLTLGANPEVIETNLQSMIKRLSSALSKLAMHGEEAPWNVKALGQLRNALSALRSSRKSNSCRSHPYEHRLRDLDSLVEGFGKMDLGYDMMAHDGLAGRGNPWRESRR